MKIVFMGTPDFARESLEALYNTKNKIELVVTNPDRKKGRGMKVIESPVKEFAKEHGIDISQPEKVRNNEEFINQLKEIEPDLLVVVAYGKILPKEVLDIPKYGAINVHGSLLPKYRGAAPIQWAIINGEKETGVTTMFMDVGMDTGDIILKEKVSISDNETTGELWQRLSKIGGELLVRTVEKIEEVAKNVTENIKKSSIEHIEENKDNANKTTLKSDLKSSEINEKAKGKNEQDVIKELIKQELHVEKQGNDYTLAPMLEKEISKIDWNKDARTLKNLIRGLDPIMGTYTFYNGKKIKIWKADVANDSDCNENIELNNFKDYENGEIIIADKKKGLYVRTGNNTILSILELQAENSKRMNVKDFLNGNDIKEKDVFKDC